MIKVIVYKNNIVYQEFMYNYTSFEFSMVEYLWKKSGHTYITDPVKNDQALLIMYNELSKKDKKGFDVSIKNITYEDYVNRTYKIEFNGNQKENSRNGPSYIKFKSK